MTMETLHENPAAAEAVVPLAFPFTRGGYRHVLLARVDRVCLVERTSTHRDSRGSVHYEVIVVQVERARRWPDGHMTPAHERYPKPKLWGSAGWTYRTHAAADRVFAVLAGERDSFPAGGVNRGTPSPTLRAARREAARADAGNKFGHSGQHPIPPSAPAPPPRADAMLGLRRKPIGCVGEFPVGATVQVASGAWVRIVTRTPCVATIDDPDRGVREVAPGTEVFGRRLAQVLVLDHHREVPGA
jgi:hypothetical protein